MRSTSSLRRGFHFSRRAILSAAAAGAAFAIAASAAAGASVVYTGIVLYPITPLPIAATAAATAPLAVNLSGDPQTTYQGQTVGAIGNRAVLWTGASVAPVALNGAAISSDALGTSGTRQVGWIFPSSSESGVPGSTNAEVWSGTAGSGMNINPVGYASSSAIGVNGNQIVGVGDKLTYTGTSTTIATRQTVALLWPSLTAAGPATTAVDLNPAGYSTSTALGTNTSNQVGFAVQNSTSAQAVSPHAMLWSGSASSAVDLNPAGFSASYANGVGLSPVLDPLAGGGLAPSGGVTEEVGYGVTTGGQSHALLWTGTAGSAVDLNPPAASAAAFKSSQAEGTNGRQQVGWASIGTTDNAMLWNGTAASALNLNSLLPSKGTWASSHAYTVDLSGRVFGTATGKINGVTATYAVAWVPWTILPVTTAGNTTIATWTDSSITSGSATASYQEGDAVTFADSSAPTTNVVLSPSDAAISSGALTPSSVTVAAATDYTFSGSGIAGSGGLTKSDTGTLSISNANTFSGPTNINQGTVILTSTGSISNSVVTVGDGTNPANLTLAPGTGATVQTLAGLNVTSTGSVTIQSTSSTNRTLLVIGSGGFTNAGSIDIANNALDIQSSDVATVTAMVASAFRNGSWTGPGITSSTAAGDSTHLTAVGVIVNTADGTNPLYGSGGPLGSFDGTSPNANDLLVKATYYGDTNLDGTVDGSDYTRLDNGFLNRLTGWYNGDFNYDGVIDGSDYTLMDNAFNTQGAAFTSTVASVTTQFATPVPEPRASMIALIAGLAILGSRPKHRPRHH